MVRTPARPSGRRRSPAARAAAPAGFDYLRIYRP
jgi:hypothetical protein